MTDSKYENRYWSVDDNDVYKLQFTQFYFYDDNVILKFVRDKDDEELFWYVSDLLKVESDCISAHSIDEAKEAFEEKVIEYIQDKIYYYEEMLEKFNEEV